MISLLQLSKRIQLTIRINVFVPICEIVLNLAPALLRAVLVQDPPSEHGHLRGLDRLRAAHHEEEGGSVTERHVSTGFSSHLRTKLRDWAVGVMSSNGSKIR